MLASGDGWLVVAKPPRLLVHRTEWSGDAVAALQLVRDQIGRHVFPVHRLDYQASGCLLFATDSATCARLQAAMSASGARKRYLALVRGCARGEGPVRVEKPMRDDQGVERDACTDVWNLGSSDEPRCSLLLAEPHTGRFHQVRRHVRDLGHPIVGDTKHGDSRVNQAWRASHGVDRLALHCVGLSLPDAEIEAVCPLFADHARVFAAMPWWGAAQQRLAALQADALPLPTGDAWT